MGCYRGTNRGANYWENEQPVSFDTGKNVLRLYSEARKLHVSSMPWTDKDGVQRPGKTVALDLDALNADAEAASVIARAILRDIRLA